MVVSTIIVDAILFDMDGTLIDSTPGVLKAWDTFGAGYKLSNSAAVAHATHGRRLYDTLKEYCGITEDLIQAEIDRFENEVILGGVTPLPGAIDLVSKLMSNPSSNSKWTIVTSASDKYAPRALERSGIPIPLTGIITANDVSEGKPHPTPYLAGAVRCGVDPKNCLVIEDAVSGLISGRRAGSLTVAVCTSTSRAVIDASGSSPDFIVSDLTKVTVDITGNKLQVTIDQAF